MPGPNARIDQVIRESLEVNDPNTRIDQVIRESFEVNNPHARLDQAIREAFQVHNPHVNLSQVLREAWISLVPAAQQRVPQGARNPWRSTISTGWQRSSNP
jgi:hypothetical protein